MEFQKNVTFHLLFFCSLLPIHKNFQKECGLNKGERVGQRQAFVLSMVKEARRDYQGKIFTKQTTREYNLFLKVLCKNTNFL